MKQIVKLFYTQKMWKCRQATFLLSHSHREGLFHFRAQGYVERIAGISQFVNLSANTAGCGGVCNVGTCSKKSGTEATPFTQTFPFCEPHLK